MKKLLATCHSTVECKRSAPHYFQQKCADKCKCSLTSLNGNLLRFNTEICFVLFFVLSSDNYSYYHNSLFNISKYSLRYVTQISFCAFLLKAVNLFSINCISYECCIFEYF